jgi:mono/diheme cytochrome c family protein
MRFKLIFTILALGLFIYGFTGNDQPSNPPKEVLARGEKVYNYVCAPCHGKDGKGDGVVSSTIFVKPRNFTSGVFKFRSTETGNLPTDEDLYESISLGFHNTAMPSFSSLSPEDRFALTEYIKKFSERFSNPNEYPLKVIEPVNAIPLSPQSIAKGREIYIRMKCWECHGVSGRGDGPAAKRGFTDDWGNKILIPDLTNPNEVKRAQTVEEIYLVFTTGLNGSPMPSYKEVLTDEEMWHLANYIYALIHGIALYDGKTIDELKSQQ